MSLDTSLDETAFFDCTMVLDDGEINEDEMKELRKEIKDAMKEEESESRKGSTDVTPNTTVIVRILLYLIYVIHVLISFIYI